MRIPQGEAARQEWKPVKIEPFRFVAISDSKSGQLAFNDLCV